VLFNSVPPLPGNYSPWLWLCHSAIRSLQTRRIFIALDHTRRRRSSLHVGQNHPSGTHSHLIYIKHTASSLAVWCTKQCLPLDPTCPKGHIEEVVNSYSRQQRAYLLSDPLSVLPNGAQPPAAVVYLRRRQCALPTTGVGNAKCRNQRTSKTRQLTAVAAGCIVFRISLCWAGHRDVA